MKKIIITAIFLCAVSTLSFGQKTIKGNGIVETVERKTANYDRVTLIGSPDVELVSGIEGNITIKAESNIIPFVETIVKDNELIIRFKENHNYTTNKGVKIIVPIQDISNIALKGSGDIYGEHVFKDSNLNVSVNGSGDISIHVENDNLNAEVIGSGDIKIKGKTNRFNGKVEGSGDLEAKNLKAKSSNLQVNGSGDIESTTENEVNANLTGSGDIKVYGNPTKITKNVKGSGDINIK